MQITTQTQDYRYQLVFSPMERRLVYWYLFILLLASPILVLICYRLLSHGAIIGTLIVLAIFLPVAGAITWWVAHPAKRRATFLRGQSHYEISAGSVTTVNERGERFQQRIDGMRAKVKNRGGSLDVELIQPGLFAYREFRGRYLDTTFGQFWYTLDSQPHSFSIVLKNVAEAHKIADFINSRYPN